MRSVSAENEEENSWIMEYPIECTWRICMPCINLQEEYLNEVDIYEVELFMTGFICGIWDPQGTEY